jgi:hypothetical protein
MVIPAGITVTITSQLDYTTCGASMVIEIYGTLTFQNGKKISMDCGSQVNVYAGGQITSGGGGGASNQIQICGSTAWSSSDGTVSGPASVTSSGVGSLPVELLFFGASVQNNAVEIDWATATEMNNSYFEIERSRDALNFEVVGITKAYGTGFSLVRQDYLFKDVSPLQGTSYYRLKQVDRNGAYKYYSIAEISVGKKSFVQVAPNPASASLKISVSEDKLGEAIHFYDMRGEEVFSITPSTMSDTYDISLLPGGIYFLQVDSDCVKISVQQ